VLLDGIQVDGTYSQSGHGAPLTLSTSRVLPVAAGTHTLTIQASARMLRRLSLHDMPPGTTATSAIAARGFAVIDLGPYGDGRR
jgi:hypothetical protein